MVNRVVVASGVMMALVLLVGFIYLHDSSIATSENQRGLDSTCPTTDTFNTIWNQWSYEYINDNPYAVVDEQMDAWNAQMVQNGCSEEWLDPLADLIEQQAASSTSVYWYDSN
jgi:hypothetical protein